MLARHYDGQQAYVQSKLALIMFTFDLAAILQGTGVTANAINPARRMNTKMVSEAGSARKHYRGTSRRNLPCGHIINAGTCNVGDWL